MWWPRKPQPPIMRTLPREALEEGVGAMVEDGEVDWRWDVFEAFEIWGTGVVGGEIQCG